MLNMVSPTSCELVYDCPKHALLKTVVLFAIIRHVLLKCTRLSFCQVRLKLNTIRSEFKGKSVLLVDDSIVRGTTSMELVEMARDAGARRVYFVSAAPPVRHCNVYGIDIPTKAELVAHNRTEEQVSISTITKDLLQDGHC